MTGRELITQYVDTGIELPEYQVNKLNNQDKKTYIRKRLLAVKNSDYHDEILADYEFNLLSKELEEKYMRNLVSRGLRHFVKKANDKDAVINRLLSSNELINKFNSSDIFNLLEYSKDKESVINRLLKSGVSKDEINKGINNYNSFNSNNTLSLIPEGYKNKIKKLLRNI